MGCPHSMQGASHPSWRHQFPAHRAKPAGISPCPAHSIRPGARKHKYNIKEFIRSLHHSASPPNTHHRAPLCSQPFILSLALQGGRWLWLSIPVPIPSWQQGALTPLFELAAAIISVSRPLLIAHKWLQVGVVGAPSVSAVCPPSCSCQKGVERSRIGDGGV